jgi:hypothetical protein
MKRRPTDTGFGTTEENQEHKQESLGSAKSGRV